jgi:hypothetical protein
MNDLAKYINTGHFNSKRMLPGWGLACCTLIKGRVATRGIRSNERRKDCNEKKECDDRGSDQA